MFIVRRANWKNFVCLWKYMVVGRAKLCKSWEKTLDFFYCLPRIVIRYTQMIGNCMLDISLLIHAKSAVFPLQWKPILSRVCFLFNENNFVFSPMKITASYEVCIAYADWSKPCLQKNGVRAIWQKKMIRRVYWFGFVRWFQHDFAEYAI